MEIIVLVIVEIVFYALFKIEQSDTRRRHREAMENLIKVNKELLRTMKEEKEDNLRILGEIREEQKKQD